VTVFQKPLQKFDSRRLAKLATTLFLMACLWPAVARENESAPAHDTAGDAGNSATATQTQTHTRTASPQLQAGTKSTMLYGRADDFRKPGGPAFPTFFSGQATDDDDQSQWPADIRGTWHGNIEVMACHASDACFRWDADFARSWNLGYQNSRVGPGIYKFEKKGKNTELTSGYCVYSVPLREDEATYNYIIRGLHNPTKEQIALIDQAIAPVMLPVQVDRGQKGGKDEVLASGISTHVELQQTQWRQLSNNSWELDTVRKRRVDFPPPKPSATIYTEGVTKVILQSDDTLEFETADARFSEDKEPLCYAVEVGQLHRGTAPMPEHLGNVAVSLIPAAGGVMLHLEGGFSSNVSVFIPGAKLKPH
jgi:hypothetical protein